MADKVMKIVTAAAAGLLGFSCGMNRNSPDEEISRNLIYQNTLQEKPTATIGGSGGVEIQGFSDQIRAISSHGDILWKIPTEDAVSALFLHESGLILAGMGNRIITINSEKGEIEREFPQLGSNSFISSLSLSDDGIFAADRNNGIVYRFSSEGRLLSLIGNTSPEGIHIPGLYFSVTSAGDGKVWISNPGNHKVEVYDVQGTYLGGFGTAGPEGFIGCCNPISLLALKDGTVLAGEKGLLRVRRFNARGELLSWIAGGDKSSLKHLPVFLYLKEGNLVISDGTDNLKVNIERLSI